MTLSKTVLSRSLLSVLAVVLLSGCVATTHHSVPKPMDCAAMSCPHCAKMMGQNQMPADCPMMKMNQKCGHCNGDKAMGGMKGKMCPPKK